MAGDWQTIAQRPIQDRVKTEDRFEDFKDFKPDLTLNVGVRKRKFEGQEEEEDAGATVVRKGWGSTTRRYPGSDEAAQDDLDSLLNKPAVPSQEMSPGDSAEPLLQLGAKTIPSQDSRSDLVPESGPSNIKKEGSDSLDMKSRQAQEASLDIPVKEEDGTQEPAVTFKKRRSKASGKT